MRPQLSTNRSLHRPPSPPLADLTLEQAERWPASVIEELGLKGASGLDRRAEPLQALEALAINQGRSALVVEARRIGADEVSELLHLGSTLFLPQEAVAGARFCPSCRFLFVRGAGEGPLAMTCSGHHRVKRIEARRLLAGVHGHARLLLVSDS